MRGRAFAPAHITAFFEPCFAEAPERTGSRGAGVTLEQGVTTEVVAERSERSRVEVWLNGRRCRCPVSVRVAEALLELRGESHAVVVSHRCEVPVAQGLGASGAGALSTAIAGSRALGLRLSARCLGRLAHRAEVECMTGLGDVIAQLSGGLVVRVSPGAPGVGEVERFYCEGELGVLVLGGERPTSGCLRDLNSSEVQTVARGCLERILEEPEVSNLLYLSRKFALSTGLASGRLREALLMLERRGISAGMCMLGNAVFVDVEDAERAGELLNLQPLRFRAGWRGAGPV